MKLRVVDREMRNVGTFGMGFFVLENKDAYQFSRVIIGSGSK